MTKPKPAEEVAREIYDPVDEHLVNEGAKALGTCDYHFLADLITARDREVAEKVINECIGACFRLSDRVAYNTAGEFCDALRALDPEKILEEME